MLTGKWVGAQTMARHSRWRARIAAAAVAVLLALLMGLAVTLGDADDTGVPHEPERSPESRTETAR